MDVAGMIGLVVSVFMIIGSFLALIIGLYKKILDRGRISMLLSFLLYGISIFDREGYSFLTPFGAGVLIVVALIFIAIALVTYTRRLIEKYNNS